MFFKSMFKKWGESLEVLKPKNIKLFSLASLNTFIKSIKIFFKYFWWLYLLFITLSIVQTISGTSNIFFKSIIQITLILMAFYLFLTIRPSVEKKDISYFAQYSNKIIGYLAIPFLIIFLISFPLIFITSSLKLMPPTKIPAFSKFIFCSVIPTCWMGYFFYFDSQNIFSSIIPSIKQAIKVLFYYLPFMLIVSLISIMLSYLPNQNVIIKIISPIINALFMSILSVYYTRVKHKDFKLFFKK